MLLNLDARYVLPVDAQIANSVPPTPGRDGACSHTGHPLDRRNGLTLRGMADMAGGRYRQVMSAFEQGLEICRPLDGP